MEVGEGLCLKTRTARFKKLTHFVFKSYKARQCNKAKKLQNTVLPVCITLSS